MALSDYLDLVPNLVGDSDDRLTPSDQDGAIRLAVLRYSQDRPRHLVEDLTVAVEGNAVDLPVDWEAEFSEPESVEYPIGDVPPTILSPSEDWTIYQAPTGPMLVFSSSLPAGADLRLSYTVKHILTTDTDTIPEQHREAVACWAAAVLCEQLASAYAANSQPTIQADRVDQTSPQRAYAQRAKDLRKRYQDEIGVGERRNVAAGTVISHLGRNSLGGLRLTHPLRGWQGQR